MKSALKYYFVILFQLLCCSAYSDANVSVSASAPKQVSENQKFQIIFTIHNATVDSFRINKLKHLTFLSGPSKSSNSTTNIIGGKLESSTSVSLSYIAFFDKKGEYEIPSADIWTGGKLYKTNTLKVVVVNKQEESTPKATPKNVIPDASNDDVNGADFFVKTEWEKNLNYVGEHNNLIYKLYYRGNVSGWDNLKLPDLKNCEVVDAGIAYRSRYGQSLVNGIVYNTVIVAKKDVQPLKKGSLSIKNGSMDIIINVPNKNDFWGGYHKVKKSVTIPGIKTEVLPATEKPIEEENKVIEEPHWNL